MISFSKEVKEELSVLEGDECCLKAELIAIIRGRSECVLQNNKVNLVVTTTSLSITRRVTYLFKKLFQVKVDRVIKKQNKLNNKDIYVITAHDVLSVLKSLHLIDENYNFQKLELNEFLKKDCCKQGLLRGYFLMRGSVNNPKTSRYHFEIVTDYEEDALMLKETLALVDIKSMIIKRTKGYVLYIKKAEAIGDVLRFMGAYNSSFAFEDERIRKDYGNYVNRIMNCDISNQQKAIASAAKQIEDIALLEEKVGHINLSPRLINAIILRTTYPDDSLADLSNRSEEVIGKYISKSGLCHCFKDIHILAEEYRKNKK